jgi:hypothetical protein
MFPAKTRISLQGAVVEELKVASQGFDTLFPKRASMLLAVGLEQYPFALVGIQGPLAVQTDGAYMRSSQMCLEAEKSRLDGTRSVCGGRDAVSVDQKTFPI